MVLFGPSGNSDSFYEQGYKSSLDMPSWLRKMGLSAYEYQCSKGVNIGRETAEKLGVEARKNNIALSIHAPYYINLANKDEEKRKNSIRYIMQTLEAASWMGADRIVVHPGSCSKIERSLALSTAIKTMREVLEQSEAAGYGDITICPELLGKYNQLGTLDEILEICSISEKLIPTIDFGHYHARSLGGLKTIEDYAYVLDKIGSVLGRDRLKVIHVHFSRVEYSNGGEKRHWNYEDTQYGPDFDPLAQLIVERNLEPRIICESRGKMAEDARTYLEIYERYKKFNKGINKEGDD